MEKKTTPKSQTGTAKPYRPRSRSNNRNTEKKVEKKVEKTNTVNNTPKENNNKRQEKKPTTRNSNRKRSSGYKGKNYKRTPEHKIEDKVKSAFEQSYKQEDLTLTGSSYKKRASQSSDRQFDDLSSVPKFEYNPIVHPFTYKRILVPVDFSLYSRRALEHAVFFADKFGSEILMVNIIEIPRFDFENLDVEPPKFEEYVKTKISNKMSELAHAAIPEGMTYSKFIEVGYPAKAIVDTAKRENADMIIMATHGHSTLDMQIFGSVAQQVIRTAPCPVYSIKHYLTEEENPVEEDSLKDIEELENNIGENE